MKITVIGGGNIGTLLASEFSKKGYETYIYSSKNNGRKKIEVYDNLDELLFISNHIVITNDLEEAVTNSKFVFVTYPPELFEKLSKELDNKLDKNTYLGIVPGSGGCEFIFKNLINQGIILFGLQRVHSIARIKEPGKSVYMLGRKDSINISVFNSNEERYVKDFLEDSLNLPCNTLDNYLTITLNPSNPILHTSRLCCLFKDYKLGKTYPENILFYESWDDESSDLLIKCDQELQELCEKIPFDLTEVKSLKEHYESYTVSDMTQKISNIPAFKGLTSPMLQNEDGLWVPDFKSRYFASDFSYGLKVIIEIANLYNVPSKNLNYVWGWFVKLENPHDCFDLKMYDIDSKENFEKYYGV